jgi:hypothetical protein
MKKLLLLGLLSINVQAAGLFSLSQPLTKSNDKAKLSPTVGLYIIEPLNSVLFYQSWTGVRADRWFTSDHSLMIEVDDRVNLGFGPGFDRSNGISNVSLKAFFEVRAW